MSAKQVEKLKKFGSRFGIIIGILLLLFVVGSLAFHWITDYIWMNNLDFGGVFTTILGSKVLLGVAGFILFSVVTYFTFFWIIRSYVTHFDSHQLPPVILKRKTMNAMMLGVSILAGLIGSTVVQGIGWEPALKLLNHASFEQTDPYFNMDISFYMFVLPFLEFIVYLLLGLSIFFLIVQIGSYSVFNMYRMSRSAQWHMGITLGTIGVLLACNHLLMPYSTLLTNQVNLFQQSVVHGMSYTDSLINIPKAYILAAVAIIGTIWMIIALRKGKIQSMFIPIVTYVGVVIVGQLASVGVQQFLVQPNEFYQEEEFLEHNLHFTQAAYELEDINETEHSGNGSLDEGLVEDNELTINNVRINDSRPLLDVYNQLQTFRSYYQFNDVDIDRYEIGDEYEQVFIGARELSTVDLPEQAQTWVNQNLRYTHGYGVTMSHVNELTAQGQPEYMLQDLPPEGDLDVSRPQIYYGEEDYPNVIVNSEVDEFDYPSGDENISNRYEEDSGISLGGINRALFALKEGSFRMFFSDQLTDESQFLETRNIMDRVNRIAPFFEYDSDPYIFVRDDGSLAWMMDAYLTGERYPYSESYQNNDNYIRNSVKVTVDAYTGEVDFYIANPDDPLVQTYQKMFPELFTEEIPADVQAHFRFPERLFSIQASMYGTYHMTDLEMFYNREDAWEFPTEKYFNEDIEMEPYYVTMKLPEYDEEEFILMMPYTPKNRQNMLAWIGVRNDGEYYGEKFVYRFPRQENIYGPQQIENRINQDSTISQELNLWSQGGSEVIRGNLLAIPIEDTVIYVEPIYIESSNETSLPEVKQVVVAYEDHIVMEETFEESMEQMLNLVDPNRQPDEEQTSEEEPGEQEQPISESDELLQEFSDLFNSYQDALAEGDWNKAAEIMTEIEDKLTEEEQ
ncbi:UPF0182 family protein [Virgibacillus sp. NKC19-3]|nr:UPF0182 family protein [Virgibacillus sp. NKC19-3]